MKRVILTRVATGEQGTFGVLRFDGRAVSTGELPWRENRRNVSCIPGGKYLCRIIRSPRFGTVYHVKNVPGRSGVLIHSGNYAGDTSRGWRTHSHGCILPGLRRGRLGDQRAVLCSCPALGQLVAALRRQPFILEIREAYDRD